MLSLSSVALILCIGQVVVAYPKVHRPHIAKEGGGVPATAYEHPFMIRMDAVDDTIFNGHTLVPLNGQMCGGSLVEVTGNKDESDIVLTAAHCIVQYEIIILENGKQDYVPKLQSIPKEKRRIVAGAHSRKSLEEPGVKIRGVARMEYNSDWTMVQDAGHDIAIIKLDKPIRFTETIKPIALPENSGQPQESYSDCVIAGWGRISSTQHPDVLYHMNVTLKDECGLQNPGVGLCAHTGKPFLPTACGGDSGGPLFCKKNDKEILTGVLSYGHVNEYNLCQIDPKTGPSVYMNTEFYLDWIKKKMEEFSNE